MSGSNPHINRTPVLTVAYLDDLTGAQLFFKCENFQEAGAFKVRGACNAVFGLDEDARKGVAPIPRATTRCRSAMRRGGGASRATW
jgi:threonine dehydratase